MAWCGVVWDTAELGGVLPQVCPTSTRYIDRRDGTLEVSASGTDAHCNSTWGRRFKSLDERNSNPPA